jgi:hypothetical protein
MTDSRAAVGFDRLPWLADEPARSGRGAPRELAGWLAAATIVVAAVFYWLGQRTANEAQPPPISHAAPRSTTVPLPAPQVAAPQVRPDRVPEVVPAPVPTVSIERPVQRYVRPKRAAVPVRKMDRPSASPKNDTAPAPTATAPAVAKAQVTPERPLTLWPSRVSQGATGRLVQIGAFGSRQQAKLGWRRMMRSYPAVGRLPATVVSARNSHGRYFYRFQIGTTSQAHSEVLCQRMEHLRFSCAVVGLPGAKKAVER